MAIIVTLFVCGVILFFAMSVWPPLHAFVEKHVLKLIEAIGTLMLWGFWFVLAYALFAWLGMVDRPYWF